MEKILYILFGILILQGIVLTFFSLKIFFPSGQKKYKPYISKSFGNDYYKEHKKIVDSQVIVNLLTKEK